MIKKIIIIYIALLITPILAQTENLMYDKLTTPISSEYYHMPVGLCEDYPEETTTMEIIRKDFELLKKHNIKFLRISFGWDAIESQQGTYDWLFWDDYVNTAVDEYGLTLLPYICYVPIWNSTGAQDTMLYWNYPPKDFEAYGNFLKALVTRYKDKIKTWELWNEPDIWIYWQGTREEFVKFMKIAAKAVREADPEAKIVFPGIAYDPNFIKDLFKNHEMSSLFDIVNIHNYYETWHHSPIEHIVNYINEVYDVVVRYGDNQPIWMAEVGYSTFRKGASVSDSYTAYYDYEHTPEYQAKQLIKTLTLVASTGKITATAWYEIKDLPPSENVIGDNDNNRYLGVAYADHRPKPAARAVTFFNQLFSIPYKSINNEVKVDRTIGSETEVQSFETADGDILILSWVKTATAGRKDVQNDGMTKDNRKENITIEIPVKLKGKSILYDELGNEWEFTTIERSANKTVIKDLTLYGGGISIIKIMK